MFFAAPRTIALQASLSRGFPRQESWTGLPFPPPGDFLNPEAKPVSWAGSFFTTEPPEKLLDTWSNISLETPGTFGVRKCGQLLRLRKEEETRMGWGGLVSEMGPCLFHQILRGSRLRPGPAFSSRHPAPPHHLSPAGPSTAAGSSWS